MVAVRLTDPGESEWSAVGLLDWQDPETGESYLVDTSSPKVRKALQAQHQEWTQQQDQQLRRGRIDALSLSTSEPYERALARFFRVRAKRRGQ